MRYLGLLALLLALTGCGGAKPDPHAARPHRSPELVSFQRNGPRRGATYLLRFHGRTYVAREGAVPTPLRPAVATLQSIVDGGGRAGPVHEVRVGQM